MLTAPQNHTFQSKQLALSAERRQWYSKKLNDQGNFLIHVISPYLPTIYVESDDIEGKE